MDFDPSIWISTESAIRFSKTLYAVPQNEKLSEKNMFKKYIYMNQLSVNVNNPKYAVGKKSELWVLLSSP